LSGKPVRYREAGLADVPAMAQIREAGGWTGGAPAERLTAYMEGRHDPQRALKPRVVYVAEEGNALVGYIAGHLTQRYQCDGELEWLHVHPSHRKNGIASRLLHPLAQWFAERHAPRVCVDVEPSNAVARSFYARHGARELNPHWLVWDDITTVS